MTYDSDDAGGRSVDLDPAIAECIKRGWPAHTHNCMECGDVDGRLVQRAGGLYTFTVEDPDDPLDGHDLLLCQRCFDAHYGEYTDEVP